MRSKSSGWKKVVLPCLGMILLSSCAGSSAYMKPSASLAPPKKDKAIVRFMRPSGFAPAINFNLMDGSRVIGNSVAKSQFDYLVDPGHHLFIATAENKVFLEADLEPAKIYYVITRIYPGAWRARVAFLPVKKGSEYWDAVLGYEKELQILSPDEEKLKAWQDANAEKIKALVDSYEAEQKAKFDWPRLAPEDGR